MNPDSALSSHRRIPAFGAPANRGEDPLLEGIPLRPGENVRILREAGVFRYMYTTCSVAGRNSLTFVGGRPGHECWRSFRLDRVRRPHSRARRSRRVKTE